ncbi:MAG: hypothetical protein NC483_01665 [Ruminococcus sp.]|nr:hypothetical protein [Ruminococcus sp.]
MWKEADSETREKYKGDTAENITMRIKEGTLTDGSTTVIIEDLNLNTKNHIYGISFTLYEKINNEWYYFPTKIDKYGWTLLDYYVNEDNLLEMEADWEWLYGKLKPGEYKLVKDVLFQEENQDNEFNESSIHTFSVDFII